MAKVTIGGRTYDVEVRGTMVVVDGHEFPVSVRDEAAHKTVNAGGVNYRVQLPPPGERASGMTVQVDYRPFEVTYEGALGARQAPPPRATRSGPAAGSGGSRGAVKGAVAAPIAGRVLAVRVSAGDAVKAGDVLLLLEAMKMENEIKAPADGTVREVLVAEGGRVMEGDGLIVIE